MAVRPASAATKHSGQQPKRQLCQVGLEGYPGVTGNGSARNDELWDVGLPNGNGTAAGVPAPAYVNLPGIWLPTRQ